MGLHHLFHFEEIGESLENFLDVLLIIESESTEHQWNEVRVLLQDFSGLANLGEVIDSGNSKAFE